MTRAPGRRLALLLLVCGIGLLFTVSLWLVNLEIAIRVFAPGWQRLETLLPASWFSFGQLFAVDLSTISTLVPVLLFLFPLVQGWRVWRQQAHDSEFVNNLEADPYPPHFAFFLVMLGLVGTLYGLMIGLDLSGVADLAGEPLSQDAIRRSLDRLLGGTATALLSSLVGILGAFAAARPMAWCFRRAIGIKPDVRRRGLSETINRVTGELDELGKASRTFSRILNPETAEFMLAQFEAQSTALQSLSSQIHTSNQYLERLVTQIDNSAQATAKTFNGLQSALERTAMATESVDEKLTALNRLTTAGNDDRSTLMTETAEGNRQRETLLTSLSEANQQLSRLETTATQCNRELSEARADAEKQHEQVQQTTNAILNETKAGRDAFERDHESRKLALSTYINGVIGTKAE